MQGSDPSGLGLILIAVGICVWLAARLLMQTVRRRGSFVRRQAAIQLPEGLLTRAPDAVLMVQPGGRLGNINPQARKLFGIQEGESGDLERIAQHFRPRDAFFTICSTESKTNLSIDGKPYEASSFQLAFEPEPMTMISLRPVDLISSVREGQSDGSAAELQTWLDFSKKISTQSDLLEMLQTTLEQVEKVMPADFLEISLWDPASAALASYRFTGPPGADRKIETSQVFKRPGEGLPGKIARDQRPLLIGELSQSDFSQTEEVVRFGLNSYLGTPLMLGNSLLGTLAAGSVSPHSFSEIDLQSLDHMGQIIAVAVRNATLLQRGQQRSTELAGLAQLAQVFRSVRESQDLFTLLEKQVSNLFQVEIAGFLLFNETARVLEAQVPFHGLPPQVVALYKVGVQPNSPLEKALLSPEVIVSQNALEDERWEQLGLQYLAQAATMRETVLVPLISGERMLGFFQVSNHLDHNPIFTKDELHLMIVVANQAAPVIENVTLQHVTRKRAKQAETLRRIAGLTKSSLTLQEICRSTVEELAQLCEAGFGAMFLLDSSRHTLQYLPDSQFGEFLYPFDSQTAILRDDPQYPFTVSGSEKPIRSGNIILEETLIPFYRRMIEASDIHSVIAVPLVVRDTGIGELWLGSRSYNFFDDSDLRLLGTAAGQLAAFIEQVYLEAQTDESLRRQVEQLTALTRISRVMSTILDLDYILQLLYDEALRLTRSDCGSIVLFEREFTKMAEPVIRTAVGETLERSLLPVELEVLSTREIRLLEGEVLAGYAPHDNIASALIAPIFDGQRPVGLITLHSRQTNWFDSLTLDIVRSLAGQTALVLGNALEYERQVNHNVSLTRELEMVQKINQQMQTYRPDRSLDQSLHRIGIAIRELTNFQMVLLYLFDEPSGTMKLISGIGVMDETLEEMQEKVQEWQTIQSLLKPKYRLGDAYLIPANGEPLGAIPDSYDENKPSQYPTLKWDPEDQLILPIMDTDREPLGLIRLSAPADGMRPDWIRLKGLELFALQAAWVLTTTRQIEEMGLRLVESEATAGLNQVQQEQLNELLQGNLEQTLTIQHLQQRMQRIHHIQEILALLIQQPDEMGALRMLASQLIERFNMQSAVVAEKSPLDVRIIAQVGKAPEKGNPELLFGQPNPLRQILIDKTNLIVPNLANENRWKNNAFVKAFRAQSMIGLSLESKNIQYGIVAFAFQSQDDLDEDDLAVIDQLAQQASTILQNLRLLAETQRSLQEMNLLLNFNQQLGSLDPLKITQSLLNSIVEILPSVEAGWVALMDMDHQVLKPQIAQGYTQDAAMLKINYPVEENEADWSDLLTSLPVRVFLSGEARSQAEVTFAEDYRLSADDLLSYRQATGGKLPVSCLVAPIKRGDNCLGVIVLDNFSETGVFSNDEENLVMSLAQQAALGLENARLFRDSEQRTAQMQALNSAAGYVTSSLSSEELISILLEKLKEITPFETGTLWLRDEQQLRVASTIGFEDHESRLGLQVNLEDSALFQEMLSSGREVLVPDVRLDARFPSLFEPNYLTWLGIPMLAKGELIGVIALEKSEAGFYSREHLQLAANFASMAAVSLVNARLFEESVRRTIELDERSQRLAILNRLSNELGATMNMDHILRVSAQHLLDGLQLDRVAALLVMDDGSLNLQLELPMSVENLIHDLPTDGLPDALRVSHGVYYSPDVTHEADLKPLQGFFTSRNVQALLIVPLVAGTSLYGWFWLQKSEPYHFTPAETEMARTIGNQTAITLQNARLFGETRRLSQNLEMRVKERTTELQQEHLSMQMLLREQQVEASRSRAILEAVADGVVVTDTDNRIFLFNASAERILGLNASKLIGKPLTAVSRKLGAQSSKWAATIQQWTHNPQPLMETGYFVDQVQLASGKVISLHLSPVTAQNDFLGTVSIFRDITHQVQVDRLKSEFVANVSHELRTPMTSIQGYVQVMLMGALGEMTPQQREFLEIVDRNTERLRILVNDLLDISRIEASQASLKMETLNLNDISQEIAADVLQQSIKESKPIRLELDIPIDLPGVQGDNVRIRQVISSLLNNSYHYTPANGNIMLRIRANEEEMQVDVQDDGIGIPRQDQPRIFERFFRGNDPLVLGTAGTGLGLAIAKNLVEMHGGRIWFTSSGKRGEGCTFSFTLPMVEAEE